MTERAEREFDTLVKQLLDGEITLADLPAELRAEGEAALQILAAVDDGFGWRNSVLTL